MLAVHDQFTRQMRNRLKTTVMGLGLVRLLQDVKRTDEARTTLYSLESGSQGGAEKSDKPSRKSNRLNGITRTGSCLPRSSPTRTAAAIRREVRKLNEGALGWGNEKVLSSSTERVGSASQRFVEIRP